MYECMHNYVFETAEPKERLIQLKVPGLCESLSGLYSVGDLYLVSCMAYHLLLHTVHNTRCAYNIMVTVVLLVYTVQDFSAYYEITIPTQI